MNLTRLSYIVVIVITALGIIGEWAPNAVSSGWRLFAATWLVLLLVEWRMARRYRFELARAIKPAIHLGRVSELHYTITNLSNRPLTLRSMDLYPDVIAEAPPIIDWFIPVGESRVQQAKFIAIQLGKLEWHQLQLRVLGLFGLAWWSRKQALVTTTEVIPDRLYSHEQMKSATAHQGDISRRVHGIGTELIGLREYLPGDPLHFIDWKASARSRKTMVRLFSDEQHLELMIVIDAGRTSSMQAGNLTRLGHYINVASRLAQKALLNGDQIGIVVFADSVLASMHRLKGHHGLQRLRSILSQIRSVARESNPLPAILRVRQLASLRSLVVMLTDLDDGDAAAQLVRAMGILQPKHQPLLAAISDSDVRQLSEASANSWLDPYHALAANEILQNWRHTRVRLERMGIPVVLSDIRYLDQQVLENYDRLKEQKRI
jgi:uncharacterized protein (DUF58 family)